MKANDSIAIMERECQSMRRDAVVSHHESFGLSLKFCGHCQIGLGLPNIFIAKKKSLVHDSGACDEEHC